MDDILLAEPWQCGDRDCTSPGTWHKATYWMTDDGYTCDKYSDGDHEDVAESDVPSADQEVIAWAGYRYWAVRHQADPLSEFIHGVPSADSEQAAVVRREYEATRK